MTRRLVYTDGEKPHDTYPALVKALPTIPNRIDYDKPHVVRLKVE